MFLSSVSFRRFLLRLMGNMTQIEETKNDNVDTDNISYLSVSTSVGKNDVLCSPYKHESKDDNIEIDNIIYFGGDIQDFQKHMIKNNTFNNYSDYSLEATLKILRDKFSTDNIFIIRPSQTNKSFSIYSNFVENMDKYGASTPCYKNGKACQHLVEFLSDKQICQITQNSNNKLHLIGFSKGVNVLNQFIYETENVVKIDAKNGKQNERHKQNVYKLFNNIKSMYFLDGGNGIKQKTLPTDDAVINNFVENIICDDFRFHIYGTTRQWEDQQRPWIGKEQKYFVDFLKKLQKSDNNDKKLFHLHYNMYNDKLLNESLIKYDVSKFKTSRNKGLYRHFEVLRVFNVLNDRFML
eukprot:505760_1